MRNQHHMFGIHRCFLFVVFLLICLYAHILWPESVGWSVIFKFYSVDETRYNIHRRKKTDEKNERNALLGTGQLSMIRKSIIIRAGLGLKTIMYYNMRLLSFFHLKPKPSVIWYMILDGKKIVPFTRISISRHETHSTEWKISIQQTIFFSSVRIHSLFAGEMYFFMQPCHYSFFICSTKKRK